MSVPFDGHLRYEVLEEHSINQRGKENRWLCFKE